MTSLCVQSQNVGKDQDLDIATADGNGINFVIQSEGTPPSAPSSRALQFDIKT
jgi:hypothetical protein